MSSQTVNGMDPYYEETIKMLTLFFSSKCVLLNVDIAFIISFPIIASIVW